MKTGKITRGNESQLFIPKPFFYNFCGAFKHKQKHTLEQGEMNNTGQSDLAAGSQSVSQSHGDRNSKYRKREAISSNAIRDNGINNDSNNSITVTMLNKLRDQLVIYINVTRGMIPYTA